MNSSLLFLCQTFFKIIFKNFYEVARDNSLRIARNSFHFAVTKQNRDFVFVALHSDSRVVCNDDVAIFFSKFLLCVVLDILSLSREADDEILSIFRERRENVARWHALERNVLPAFLDLVFGNLGRLVIRNRRAHHENVTARGGATK